MLGVFLAALDQMIVTVAIRTIGDQLHGLDSQAWVTTAYLITSTVSTPLYGKLSDIYGRKPFFLASILIFIIGSVACAFATSMTMLAAFRAVQGLGAGGLMSLALAIIGDIVPPRERARYQAYFLAVFGTSSVAGPVIGGFLAGQPQIAQITGWRWVFLVNVPVAAVALAVVAKVLDVPHPRRRHRIDWWGALTVSICLVPLLLVAEQGTHWGWQSTRALVCYGVGGVGLAAFLLAEALMRDAALIPLRLFRSGVVTITSLAGVIIGMGMFGAMAVIPLYLQIVKGASPTRAGLLMLPVVLGISAGSVLSGRRVASTGRYKIYPIIGTALMAVGLLLLCTVDVDTPLWRTDVWMFVVGFGIGNCLQTLVIAVQNAVRPDDMGVASASSTFFRQIGATAGTALFLSILFTVAERKVSDAFRHAATSAAFQAALRDPRVRADPANAPVLGMARPGATHDSPAPLRDSSFLAHLDPRLARPYLVGFAEATHPVFLIAAAAVAVALLLLLFLPELPLRARPGAPSPREASRPEPVTAPPAPASMPSPAVDDDALDRISHLLSDLDNPESLRPDGVPISGHIRRSDGGGITEAAVTLIDTTGHQFARAVSHLGGRYRLCAPRPGGYLLVASAAGHQPQACPVTVTEQPVVVDITLAGTSALAGRVATAAGTPIAGATVALADTKGEVIAAALTGDDGHYRFADLVRGSYTLVVNAEHYRPVAAAIAVPSGRECTHDVVLTGAARLHGVACSADGRPVREARIALVDGTGAVIDTVTTDETGEYLFVDLPDGQYRLVAAGYPRVVTELSITGADTEHDVRLAHPDAP
jgi:EmrB/QacA subfamily drug resistance transporter